MSLSYDIIKDATKNSNSENIKAWWAEIDTMRKGWGDKKYRRRKSDVLASGDPEDFDENEILLAILLAKAIDNASDEALPILEKALQDMRSAEDIEGAIAKVNRILRESVSSTSYIELEDPDLIERVGKKKVSTEEALKTLLEDTMLTGGLVLGSINILAEAPRGNEVLNAVTQSTKFFTNEYFERIVSPKIMGKLERIGAGELANTAETFADIRNSVNTNLKDSGYFRTVANSSVSRSYHYGAMKAAQKESYRAYRIKAVLDSKTTKICQYLNNKEFWLSDASYKIEQGLLAEPLDFTSSPFLSPEEIIGKTTQQLIDAGVTYPPFHFNCRSSVEFIKN